MEAAKALPNSQQKPQRKGLILVAVSMFTLMATLDGSIVNIAIPTISDQFGINMNQSEWIVSVYMMVICMFLLLFGKLGDTMGKVKIFKIGTIIFVLGSLLCGISTTLTTLLLSRVVQAVGASMTMATNFGIITETYPPNERGKALGILGSFVSLGSIAGPGLGGIIIAHFSWEYIFLINVPIGIIAIVMGALILPKDEVFEEIKKVDYKGFSLVSVVILTLFGGIFIGQEAGYTKPYVLLLFALAVIGFLLLIRVENKIAHPLIDMTLFKNKAFSLALLCALFVFSSNFFYNVLMPFYLQKSLSLSASMAGLLLMVLPLTMVVLSPISGMISDKIGPDRLTFIGLLCLTIAQLLYLFVDQHSPIAFFVILSMFIGAGNAFFQSPNNVLIMSSVPPKQLGVAGGLNALARNLGMVIGVALSTSVLYLAMSAKDGSRITTYIDSKPDLFIFGMHITFLVSSILCIAGLIITGSRLFKKSHESSN